MLLALNEQGWTFIHISAWSQIGVLSRIYLDAFFTYGCHGSWGVCLLSEGEAHRTYGSYFPDLAANMLGSFIMGVLTSASALKGESARAVAILPEDHAWQDAPELLVGLRTGYCGSLTTFASWELTLVTLLIGGRGYQGGQWAEFLWGLIIGFQLALSSYMFGAHLAANLDAYFTGANPHYQRAARLKGARPVKRATADDPKSRKGAKRAGATARATGPPSANGGPDGEDGWDLEERGQIEGREAETNGVGAENGGQVEGLDAGRDGWRDEEKGKVKDANPRAARKTHIAALLMAVLLISLWIILAIVDSHRQHAQRRRQWFALLFAPFGAALRWKLAQLNGRMSGWKWFPIGTLAANLTACCIDFGIQAGLQRITAPGYWVMLLLKAVQAGFSGALSTVSTFVAEVHSMPGEKADNVHGYIYGFLTISLGALAGIIIYGWSVWA